MLVVLAIKKIYCCIISYLQKKKVIKLDTIYLLVILQIFPKFGFTPRKVVNKVRCEFFNLPVRKVLVFLNN